MKSTQSNTRVGIRCDGKEKMERKGVSDLVITLTIFDEDTMMCECMIRTVFFWFDGHSSLSCAMRLVDVKSTLCSSLEQLKAFELSRPNRFRACDCLYRDRFEAMGRESDRLLERMVVRCQLVLGYCLMILRRLVCGNGRLRPSMVV